MYLVTKKIAGLNHGWGDQDWNSVFAWKG